MADYDFFEHPIINSPYLPPERHWRLEDGQPTNEILATGRCSELMILRAGYASNVRVGSRYNNNRPAQHVT